MSVSAKALQELEELSYQDLRSQLKAAGLPAVGKAEVLRERLAEAKSGGGSKSGASLKKTMADAAASKPLPDAPALPVRSPPGTTRRQRTLSSLQQEEDREEGPQTGGEAVGNVASAIKEAAAVGAEDLQEAWEATKEHLAPLNMPVSQKRREAANYTSSAWARLTGWWPAALPSWQFLVLVFLLGALSGAALTMWAHPDAWQDVRRTANAGYGGAWQYTNDAMGAAGRTWQEAFPRGQWGGQGGGDPGAPLHCRAALAAALPALLPPPDGPWAGLSAQLRALPQEGAPLHKGLGLLSVCETAGQCAAAVDDFRRHIPVPCAGCLLHITGEQLAQGGVESRGALQTALVATLQACPFATVFVDAATLAAAPAAMPVLINALSERGHFTTGGQAVPATDATYIVTLSAPADVMAAAADEDAFKSAAKSYFVRMLAGAHADEEVQSRVRGLAEVLRRRLDFVVPLGGGASAIVPPMPAAEEALLVTDTSTPVV